MYPVTIAGRILTCACSFSGLATSAVLVSVLVERYQRIYTRKQFLPDQVMTALNSSDNEDDEKQEFINRKLSGLKKTLSGKSIALSMRLPHKVTSESSDRKFSRLLSSSSHVRFIITITDDQTNDKTADDTAHELMTQLRETIHNTGEQLNLRLIHSDVDPTEHHDHQTATTDRLTSISEENSS